MESSPNVIVLVFDTLRSDYLSCYGSDVETPAFDSLADDGVLFESAFGTAPGTPISHASLYTGQYPSEHGVTGQYIDLPEGEPTIAEWLNDSGYDTYGITGPAKMGSEWGYDRGFDAMYEPYYEHPDPTSWKNITKSLKDPRFGRYFFRQVTRGGNEKTRLKFDLIRDQIESDLDAPFFTLCNFTTVHAPYDPPRPYKQSETEEFSRPRWFFLEYLLDDAGSISDDDIRLDRVYNVQTGDGIGKFLSDPDYLNEKEVELLRDWYAASVRHLDAELERFLEFYRSELADDTILVVTADHGEQLGERNLWEHSHYLYDETLNVPLIVAGPGVPEGQRRSDLVSHVDVFDTICDRCDLEAPEATSGTSLFDGPERDAVFMEYGERDIEDFRTSSAHGRYMDRSQLKRFSAGRKGIRTEDYQFEVTSNGTEQFYDLPGQVEVEDPPEETVREARERLFDRLGEEFGTWPEGDPADDGVDADVTGNLRQLGYID